MKGKCRFSFDLKSCPRGGGGALAHAVPETVPFLLQWIAKNNPQRICVFVCFFFCTLYIGSTPSGELSDSKQKFAKVYYPSAKPNISDCYLRERSLFM